MRITRYQAVMNEYVRNTIIYNIESASIRSVPHNFFGLHKIDEYRN